MAHGSTDAQRFQGWIARRLGLQFDDSKLEFLTDILQRRAAGTSLALRNYLDRLEGPSIDAEVRALAHDLTVPETYFFRHMEQFLAFADVALPQAQSARSASRQLRLLSVGCASGEEPYSLAMMVRERGADVGWNIDIEGVDLNPVMLARAARGMYSVWSLRQTPAESQRRWFREEGREFELEQSIRAGVTFREVNLAQENSGLWAPQAYDVIFCRNVLMYFTPDSARALVARLTHALAPGGHLFLGHAETLRGLSNDYHLCHTHGTFYYQRKPALLHEYSQKWAGSSIEVAPDTLTAPTAPPPTAPAPATAGSELPWARTWVDAVQQASDRIQILSERSAGESVVRVGPKPGRVGPAGMQLQLALDLLKRERFTDALDLIGRLPMESGQDPEVLLLRAALLTHSGDLVAAERVSGQLLQRDELNTGAHYLLALCRESAGDRQGAIEHDQAAIYLDSGFAMPRLHLGLMARRAGEREGARRELSYALTLLEREDAARLLLFGGGFGREALIALCRAELKSAGGEP
jgi:chemotaxis protein methyltransferase CheR